MRSVDRCETCQPRTQADGQLVTESNLSLRVPARVAAGAATAGVATVNSGVEQADLALASAERRAPGARLPGLLWWECELAKSSEAASASALGSTARCQCAVIFPSRRW